MKKFYTLISGVILFSSALVAQPFFDNFDSYTAGQMLACQNPTHWTTWTNSPCLAGEDALVTNAQSFSSPNSVIITQNIDLVKPLGSVTSGVRYISFMMYIPTAKAGYFNLLAGFTPNPFAWGMEVYFNVGGTGIVNANGIQGVASFNYAYNTWQMVEAMVNLSTNQLQLRINGNLIGTWVWTAGASGTVPLRLDAVDFFGASANDEMYFDDFWFAEFPLPVELTSFTASVNPTGHVVLNWSTALEINNRLFEIERKSAEGEFTTIGYVEGAGTTTEEQNYVYIDKTVQSGIYSYRLKQFDFDGRYEYSDVIEVEVLGPLTFALHQNYPNPFNPSTTIKYNIPEAGNITLAVYNLLGEEIRLIESGYKEAGFYEATFNAETLPSGTYIYKLQNNERVQAKKMILMK